MLQDLYIEYAMSSLWKSDNPVSKGKHLKTLYKIKSMQEWLSTKANFSP